MRRLVWISLALAPACAPVAVDVPRLDAPDHLVIADAPLGELTSRRLRVENRGTAEARVAVSVEGPLVASDLVVIAAGAAAEIVVGARPEDLAADGGVVWLRTALESRRVDVSVEVDVDVDGDGALDPAAGGDDCDDRDPGRAPGLAERCDGVDEDCDGLVDEDPIDAPPWFVDGDRDGWGAAPWPTPSCARPAGAAAQDGDCDDGDPSVNPGARDRPYDGVDQDCDGWSDYDADQDGFDSSGHGGEDCRDADRNSHPGAPERPDDGVDQDCDGFVDERPPTRGELVLAEVLPVGVFGPAYVELRALAPVPVELVGAALRVDDGPALSLPATALRPGAAWVACAVDGPACDAVLPALGLGEAVTVLLDPGLDEIGLDALPWQVGVAAELLDPDPDANDDPAAWCAAIAGPPEGDLGTPGEARPSCAP